MFKIDYSIKLNGKKYSSTYACEDASKTNIFSIKGKNDNGKTTLLKIVAEAFGASEKDNDTISEPLKRDISDIADEENELNYNLTLGYPDDSTTVKVEYNGKDHKYKINGNEVGKTQFLEQFAVLYEVRERMSDKLDRHMNDVKNRFVQYLNYITLYESNLRTLFEKVSNYEGLEGALNKARITIANLRKNLSSYQSIQKVYEEDYHRARKEYINYIYEKKISEFKRLDQKRDEIRKKIQRTKNYAGGSSKKWNALLEKSNDLRDDIWKSTTLFQQLNNQELKNKFSEISKNLKVLSNLNSITFDYLSQIYTFFQSIKEFVREESKGHTDDLSYKEKQELSFLKSLLEIIKEYSKIDIELPGSGKKLTELLKPLENRYHELNLLIGRSDVLEALDKKSTELISKIGEVTVELKNYEKDDKLEEEESKEENPEELNRTLREICKRIDKLLTELANIDDEYKSIPHEEKYGFRCDPGVEEDYEKSKKNYEDIVNDIDKTMKELEVQEKFEKSLNEIKKPQTTLTTKDINSLSEKVGKLKNKFNNYIKELEDISLSMLEDGRQLDETDSDFFLKIGTYLASVVEVLYHEHKSLKVKSIDFQKRRYILEDGTTIKTSTVGSGHSSLNAIVSRIKIKFPEKKKILLIDEITDMDPGVRRFLIEEVKRQISSGESVLAVLTQWEYERDENELVSIL